MSSPSIETAPRSWNKPPKRGAAEEVSRVKGAAQFHWTILLVSALVLVLSFVLRVQGEEYVMLPVVNLQLPEVCNFKRLVGADCPGCGLTRCFISLVHGDVTRAWHFNPAGVLFFAIVAGQIPYRMLQIWRLHRGKEELRPRWLTTVVLAGLVIGLLVQWIARLVSSNLFT